MGRLAQGPLQARARGCQRLAPAGVTQRARGPLMELVRKWGPGSVVRRREGTKSGLRQGVLYFERTLECETRFYACGGADG